MESCQDSSALEPKLHEFMPKKPKFKFELLKCNKAVFFLPFFFPSPLSRCPKPLADVEVFSNVSLLVLSWENGSQHSFSRKPQELFLLTTSPNNSHERKAGGEQKGCLGQHEKTRTTSQNRTKLKINNRISLGSHRHCDGEGGVRRALPASLFFPAIFWCLCCVLQSQMSDLFGLNLRVM